MRRLLGLLTVTVTLAASCSAGETNGGSGLQRAADRPAASNKAAKPKATEQKSKDQSKAPGNTSTAKPTEPKGPDLKKPPKRTPPGVPAGAQAAIVASITDGDTLHLSASRPGKVLDSTQDVAVRLLEIDTPETVDPSEPVQCYGPQATTALTRLAPPGSTVYVLDDEELMDPYDRILLYLWSVTGGKGRFVNKALIHGGYAIAALYEPNDLYIDVMRSAEADARAADRGLWGACSGFGAPLNPPSPTPSTKPSPKPFVEPKPGKGCDPSYSGACIPPYPPDLDCTEISAQEFRIVGDDPHGFDADNDGIGCDT